MFEGEIGKTELQNVNLNVNIGVCVDMFSKNCMCACKHRHRVGCRSHGWKILDWKASQSFEHTAKKNRHQKFIKGKYHACSLQY